MSPRAFGKRERAPARVRGVNVMLTNISIRNFKRFEDVSVELGGPVMFIGPNNSGKTSAMQALALWDIGVKRWAERHGVGGEVGSRRGVTVNRRDLIAMPVPNANLLWRGRRSRDVKRENGKPRTENVRIEIVVDGVSEGERWRCGMEFDYANAESIYCRPLRVGGGRFPDRMPVPKEAADAKVAFLPPMSGLAATETRLDIGAVNVRVGEGRTAEVLRNLCYRIQEENPDGWGEIVKRIDDLFGARLDEARYIAERGEIAMTYRERGSVDRDFVLDLSSGGRGLQQTLLILAYLYANPGAALLLDEPDAHLEILRQRQIYQLITETAERNGSQIIAASHSETLLNEAADRDMVIAFVGEPHRMDRRGSQVLKALREIGFEHYYQAEQTGWALYVEGPTDLAILRSFARRLCHAEAERALERPYAHYLRSDVPHAALRHYYGLREALPNLKAVALFDRIESPREDPNMNLLYWRRREIENYLCSPRTLEAYAESSAEADFRDSPLFAANERIRRLNAMREAVDEISAAMRTLGKGCPWSADAKVSDDFLTPLFARYFDKLGLPNLMNKKDFYELAESVPEDELDAEIGEKLDSIARTAREATPPA